LNLAQNKTINAMFTMPVSYSMCQIIVVVINILRTKIYTTALKSPGN